MNYELLGKLTNADVINDIGQFRFCEGDATKERLPAVSNTNKFILCTLVVTSYTTKMNVRWKRVNWVKHL